MPAWLAFALFLTLFFGLATVLAFATGGRRKMWAARPSVLRDLAARRGYRFVEQPGKPADLAPIRPVEKKGDITQLSLPAAAQWRTSDGEGTLFDLFTERVVKIPGRRSYFQHYRTFITLRADAGQWTHFEFSAVSMSKPDSMTGALLAMAGNLAESLMNDRGLKHVPIPDRPGYQLFAEDPGSATALRDALVRLFDQRPGWWVGAAGDSMTICRNAGNSGAIANLVPAKDLDRFIDDALEIERALRGAALTPR